MNSSTLRRPCHPAPSGVSSVRWSAPPVSGLADRHRQAAPAPSRTKAASAVATPAQTRADALSPDVKQLRTPLLDAVRQRGDAVHEAPFHVPGHKRGAGAPAGLISLVRPPTGTVLQYDLTEVAGLDYLSSPSGAIREAQQLAASAFGADHTWFLVNGCSVGIHAAVVAATAAATARAAGAAAGARVHHAAPPAMGATGGAAATAAEGDAGPRPQQRQREGTTGEGRHSGSSGGRAAAGSGTLVVARNCHLSAFSAMVIAGCEPYWVQPEVDPRFGVAHCVTRGSVEAALEEATRQGRTVVGVLIVSPTYFGAVADVEGIAAACHRFDVPLIVDEAHGGHFAFLPDAHGLSGAASSGSGDSCFPYLLPPSPPCAAPPPAPPSALSCGADLVVQSTHKVLGALTQAAMLHARGPRVCRTRIGRALQTLQSSSPSYLLMASLDAARAQAATGGAFEEPSAAAQLIREAVSRGCRTVKLLDECTAGSRHSVLCFDPLRLTLLVEGLGLPGGGFEAAEWLESRHGVVPELATVKTVVLALGPGSTLQHARAAAAAVQELDRLAIKGQPNGVGTAADHHDGTVAAGKVDVEGQSCPATAAISPEASRAPVLEPAAAAAVTGTSAGATEAPAAFAAQPVEEAVEVVLTPRGAYFAPVVSVLADEAVGRVSAELLCPYPPGVPVLFPGERVTPAALAALRATLAAGGAVTGASDGSLGTLVVVAGG